MRHEQAAVHAADGYARATGDVGVALVTSGPGATEAALRDTMCRDMADRVGKLFRKWTPDFDADRANE